VLKISVKEWTASESKLAEPIRKPQTPLKAQRRKLINMLFREIR
jgi:hypothetical protein